jgi:hypothetical protein
MSKRKSIFIIQIYRRGDGQNLPLRDIFGAFSSLEKALKWLMTNKEEAIKEFARGHVKKNLFFVILEHGVCNSSLKI